MHHLWVMQSALELLRTPASAAGIRQLECPHQIVPHYTAKQDTDQFQATREMTPTDRQSVEMAVILVVILVVDSVPVPVVAVLRAAPRVAAWALVEREAGLVVMAAGMEVNDSVSTNLSVDKFKHLQLI